MTEKNKLSGITLNVKPEERALIRRVCEAEKRNTLPQIMVMFRKREKELIKAGELEG